MIKFELTEHIGKSIKEVFEFITDLSNVSDSLKEEGAIYRGTKQTSEGPIGLGTTYTDKSTLGSMHGEIVKWEPLTRVKFIQKVKLIFFTLLEVRITYTLEESGDKTTKVIRDYEMELYGIFRLMEKKSEVFVKKENERILNVMKKRLEN